MGEIMTMAGGLAVVGLAIAALLVPGCIVQTGTRPAVMEDAGQKHAATEDGDAAAGTVGSGGGDDVGKDADGGADATPDGGGAEDTGETTSPDGDVTAPTCDPEDLRRRRRVHGGFV